MALIGKLQVLDVSISKPFKSLMREDRDKWKQSTGDDDLTWRVEKPTIAQVCRWVITSWNGVKHVLVIKSFKKCEINIALNWTKDDAVCEGYGSGQDDFWTALCLALRVMKSFVASYCEYTWLFFFFALFLWFVMEKQVFF